MTIATITGTASYAGLKNDETFPVTGTPTATFATSDIGTGIAVTVLGYTAPNGNYSISQPTGLTADILLIKTSFEDGSWNVADSWNPTGVPLATEDIVVDHAITIDNTATCKDVTINAGKSLTINAGKDLTVSGDLTTNGLLTINSEAAPTDDPPGAGSGSLIVYGTSSGNVTYNRWMDNTNMDPTVQTPSETTPGFSRWYVTSAPVNVTSGFDDNSLKIHIDKRPVFPNPPLYDFANYITSTNDWDYVPSLPVSLTPGKGYIGRAHV